MRFTEQLRRQTADLRRQVLDHPFVQGIGDGDLPLESFRFYMCQDYVFLVDYCRVLALAVAKADDLETMGRFAGLLHETLNTEMDLHRGFAAKFGITAQELEDTQGAPGTRAYTQHLLAAAYAGDLADITAAILPCMWDYSDIGRALAARDSAFARSPCTTTGFRCTPPRSLARWPPGCATCSTAWRAMRRRRASRRLSRLFADSCRYEYLFWDMAYRRET